MDTVAWEHLAFVGLSLVCFGLAAWSGILAVHWLRDLWQSQHHVDKVAAGVPRADQPGVRRVLWVGEVARGVGVVLLGCLSVVLALLGVVVLSLTRVFGSVLLGVSPFIMGLISLVGGLCVVFAVLGLYSLFSTTSYFLRRVRNVDVE